MLRQARPIFDNGAATVAHSASRPQSTPAVVIKNLRGAGVRLIKSRNNFFARDKRLVASKASRDGAVEICFCQRILKATGDSQALELAHIDDQLQAFRTRAIEIDGHENAGDGNFVVLKTIPAGVQVSV